ncbi:MAG: AAA family ATPase [Acidimicrobiales bacterium]
MPHLERGTEQAYVDHAYARLQAMRDAAQAMLGDAFAQRGRGTPQSITERDVSVRTSLARLGQLEIGDEPLIFGRIDTAGGVEDGAVGEAFHIGRLAVSDDDQEPLVVDWRAPVAEPFYRATGRHAMGLARRRHFLTRGREVTDLEDELFGGEGPDAGLGVGGSTVLLRALDRSRTGRMRDIVATVQREQDEVIRAPLAGVLVVQGGPGTGKTAVALHRAAYLLYTHRFPLERQGVLVVGPNPLFLRYIEHVLPSLGESGVELSTIGGLVHRVAAGREESVSAARVKGDARMARVLAKAVTDRQRPLRRSVRVPYGSYLLTFSVEDSAEVVGIAKRRAGPHNARRRVVEQQLARVLGAKLDAAQERARRAGLVGEGEAPPEPPRRDLVEMARELRRLPPLVEALDRMWPVLEPEELLHDLLGAPPLVELAATRWLRPDERGLLVRPRSPSVDQVRWTDADLPLLDEARALLGPTARGHRVAGAEEAELRTFGHIVVDEAQDLSPMQLRMLGRRSLSGSMTLVGDIAQATGPFAPRRWGDQLAHLPTRRGAQQVDLSVNYRTPAEIMELAGRVLALAAPWLSVPESVRTGDAPPVRVRIEPGQPWAPAVAAAVAAEQQAVGAGTVAVVVAPSLVAPTSEALEAGGVAHQVASVRSDLASGVTVLAVEAVKGLEFDAVVVVEPARLVGEAAQGLRSLFVALTRPTQRLALVHSEPLPDPLR